MEYYTVLTLCFKISEKHSLALWLIMMRKKNYLKEFFFVNFRKNALKHQESIV